MQDKVMTTTEKQEKNAYLWLEEVEEQNALQWVEQWNQKTIQHFKAHPLYEEIYQQTLSIIQSKERIAHPSLTGEYVYNLLQDDTYKRGLWRRCAKESFIKGQADWETLIDLDALSKQEGEKWVFKGATGLYPEYKRFLIYLSSGGSDATVIREFDVEQKAFVHEEEKPFNLPESKGNVTWLNENTLLVSKILGEQTKTNAGYPNQVRLWKRGTDINEAPVIFKCPNEHNGLWVHSYNKPERTYHIFYNAITFYKRHYLVLENDRVVRLNIPEDAELYDIFQAQTIWTLHSDWQTENKVYKQGSLISIPYDSLVEGRHHPVQLIWEPEERSSLEGIRITRNHLFIHLLDNVKSKLLKYKPEKGQWKAQEMKIPDAETLHLGSASALSDDLFLYGEGFLQATTLFHINPAGNQSLQALKSMPSFFEESKFKFWQYEVKSKDGTLIPYFLIGPKSLETHPQPHPTLLYAYGGFNNSMLPYYLSVTGKVWLEQGGVYVLANIRGGGEFGPGWHRQGLKENRQKVYDDFHAVAESLIAKNITSPKQLGISGGSNGGLLVGVAFTQRPELYNAVICSVPLLDMKRYHKLLAGASWIAEYGNPDEPDEWAYIKKYSPFHNLKTGQNYPKVFFTTSTKDDRVHPGHARKMVAKMSDMGYNIYYYENTEGGHAGASTPEQRASITAMKYVYLLQELNS